jgi:hypothetical protein
LENTDYPRRLAELAGVNHQIEGEVVPCEPGKACPPRWIVHEVPAGRKTPRGILAPTQNVTYAATGLRSACDLA